jgi:ElaB/YqjD/DUF883 family membrane-anchored ribosome-binding protein
MIIIFANGARQIPMKNNQNPASAQGAKDLQKLSDDLDAAIHKLDEISKEIKKLEAAKEECRSQVFQLMNDHIEKTTPLQTDVVFETFPDKDSAEKYVEEHYPGWRIVQHHEDKIVIEENPEKMKFTWTTKSGHQINRTTAVVGTKFDYEWLMDHNPDLFREVVDAKTVYEINEKKTQEILEKHPHYLSVLQDSTKLGKVQLRLSSLKKVSEE